MTDVSNTPATAAVTTTTPWRRLLVAAVILATIAGVTMYRKQSQALDVQEQLDKMLLHLHQRVMEVMVLRLAFKFKALLMQVVGVVGVM